MGKIYKYLIWDWDVDFSVNSRDIKKQVEQVTLKDSSLETKWKNEEGEGKKRSGRKLYYI